MSWLGPEPLELREARRLLFRAGCRVRCLTASLDRIDPADFDSLMDQIEEAQQEEEEHREKTYALACAWAAGKLKG